ncbi:MAG: DUF4437 domain-containing protein [Pseudomonadota bacterium]
MRPLLILLFHLSIFHVGFTQITQASTATQNTLRIVPVTKVVWEPLNPARGDKSPQAGTLWGDRKAEVPTGFLAKFVDGFSSPPHIHNATYRAVVIDGLIHNDDPTAATMWMPTGSFWTQPAGEAHITSAQGQSNIAIVEIDRGPYLVKPISEAFDNGERPINLHASNIVWLDIPGYAKGKKPPQMVYLWGKMKKGQHNGSFLKLPAKFSGQLFNDGSKFHAVLISGELMHKNKGESIRLTPGSYFGSETQSRHHLTNNQTEAIILYINTHGVFTVKL